MRESYEINRRDGRHRLEDGGSVDRRDSGGQFVNKCIFREGIPLVASGHPRHRLEDGRLRTVFPHDVYPFAGPNPEGISTFGEAGHPRQESRGVNKLSRKDSRAAQRLSRPF